MNKIFQLNLSVKDKLMDLNIFEKTKDLLKYNTQFEETLKAYSQRNTIDIEFTLAYIAKNFRMKFQKELAKIKITSDCISNISQSNPEKEDSFKGLYITLNTKSDKKLQPISERKSINNDDKKSLEPSENLTNHKSLTSYNSNEKLKSKDML